MECNPVFGDQLATLVKDVAAGKEVPKETIVQDKAFDQSTTQADVDARKY